VWLNLLPTLLKTGSEIYKNKQKTKIAISEAELLHAEKMKKARLHLLVKYLKTRKTTGRTNLYF